MIGAIVLAAGTSSRMGRDKATLRTSAGKSFIDAIDATLDASGIDVVRVVVASESKSQRSNEIVNPDPSRGMLSSIQCGLRALDAEVEAVLIWPVDHPLVARATVEAIVDAFHETAAPVVVPTHAGRRGHPVLFAARIFPELMAADATQGARAVVHAHDDRLELPVDDAAILADIDTPDDYERHFRS